MQTRLAVSVDPPHSTHGHCKRIYAFLLVPCTGRFGGVISFAPCLYRAVDISCIQESFILILLLWGIPAALFSTYFLLLVWRVLCQGQNNAWFGLGKRALVLLQCIKPQQKAYQPAHQKWMHCISLRSLWTVYGKKRILVRPQAHKVKRFHQTPLLKGCEWSVRLLWKEPAKLIGNTYLSRSRQCHVWVCT